MVSEFIIGFDGLLCWTMTALLCEPIVEESWILIFAVDEVLKPIFVQASEALLCISVIVGPRGLVVLFDGRPRID